MLRSLMAKLKHTLVAMQALASATIQSTAVSTAHAGSLCFDVLVGAFTFTGGNTLSLGLEHADPTVENGDTPGAYTAVPQAEVFGADANGFVKVYNANLAAAEVQSLHYLGDKKFVRVRFVVGGTVTAQVAAVAIQGNLEAMPPA